MRKPILTIALAAACLLGPTAAAHAATGHQSCPTHCTPAPKPPKGGWPCQATHTCKQPKVPHCPPKKHHRHPKPPVVTPPSSAPIPPVKTAPKPHHVPAARVRLVAASVTPTQLPNQLAYTASVFDLEAYVVAGGAALMLGTVLVLVAPCRRYSKAAKR